MLDQQQKSLREQQCAMAGTLALAARRGPVIVQLNTGERARAGCFCSSAGACTAVGSFSSACAAHAHTRAHMDTRACAPTVHTRTDGDAETDGDGRSGRTRTECTDYR